MPLNNYLTVNCASRAPLHPRPGPYPNRSLQGYVIQHHIWRKISKRAQFSEIQAFVSSVSMGTTRFWIVPSANTRVRTGAKTGASSSCWACWVWPDRPNAQTPSAPCAGASSNFKQTFGGSLPSHHLLTKLSPLPQICAMKVDIHDRKHQLALAGAGTALLASGWLLRRHLRNRVRRGPLTPDTLPSDAYDAIIVGAGEVV